MKKSPTILAMPKVSVIIPIYNAEQYLAECLESIINQSLKEIEIIGVNDGSTDNSLKILEAYAQRDKRIKIITQANRGAGAARNRGLAEARGEYLSFLDSDDIFASELLETMYKTAKDRQADICVCRSRKQSEKEVSSLTWALKKFLIKGQTEFNPQKEYQKYIFQIFCGFPWDKLFRHEFIKTQGIKFQEIRHSNDLTFVYMALALADKITYTEQELITYRQHEHSLSHSLERAPSCFATALTELEKQLKSKKHFNQDIKRSFNNFACEFALWHYKQVTTPEAQSCIREEIGKLNKRYQFNKFAKKYFYQPYLYDEIKELLPPPSATKPLRISQAIKKIISRFTKSPRP